MGNNHKSRQPGNVDRLQEWVAASMIGKENALAAISLNLG
jgi:hypothetical protein